MLLGYCEECGHEITTDDACLPDYRDVYECSNCGHPHSEGEWWDEVPYYIKDKE